MTSRADVVAELKRVNDSFSKYIKLNLAMGITIVSVDDGRAKVHLPYRADLAGDSETGVLHGGAISTLMDTCCGMACFMGLPAVDSMATLDLRIDYLKPATPGLDVVAEAEVLKATRSVVFVRGVAYHTDKNDPIASCAGSFMLGTPIGRSPK